MNLSPSRGDGSSGSGECATRADVGGGSAAWIGLEAVGGDDSASSDASVGGIEATGLWLLEPLFEIGRAS